MYDDAHSQDAGLRELRGAGGLRGVRTRRTGRGGSGARTSAGRGPSNRARWDRAAIAPRAVDRVERALLPGLDQPLPCRLYSTAAREPLPVIVAWGAGGTSQPNLDTDDAWARELSDRTGALVMLCGARRLEGELVTADGVALYTHIARHALAWGGHPFRFGVVGRGVGAALARSVAVDAAGWPEVVTPRICSVGVPLADAITALRGALELPAPAQPAHPLRPGSEVRTLDGTRLGTVGEVRESDFQVRRSPGLADLHVPLRSVAQVHGAVTVSAVAAEVDQRAWGAADAGVRRLAAPTPMPPLPPDVSPN